MTPLLGAAALASLAAAAGPLLMLRALRRQERLNARLLAFSQGDAIIVTRPDGGGLLRLVARVGGALARSGLLSAGTLVQLDQTLSAAGLRGPNGLALFVGFKLLLIVTLPALAWFAARGLDLSPLLRNGSIAAAAVVGLLLPDYYVRKRRANVIKRLQAGLPDALDMLVICSEAGLGLEPAIVRVATEIGHAHPDVADELRQMASELRVAADRRTALLNMGARTGLEGLKRLGATLVQTLQYGTPLSQALRLLSIEMRGEMLVRFEERAARLPVLLTVPMIVFILPTVFMVVGGPAMISVLGLLRN